MKEYITFAKDPFESYLDRSDEYTTESFDDTYDELCELYIESFNQYLDECDFYQEGEILDYAKGVDTDNNKVVKVLLFIPRLIIALAKSIYNKITGKNNQDNVKLAEAIAADPEKTMEEMVAEDLEARISALETQTAYAARDAIGQLEKWMVSKQSKTNNDDTSSSNDTTADTTPSTPDNPEPTEKSSELVDYNGPTKSGKNIKKLKGSFKALIPATALSIGIDTVYLKLLESHCDKIDFASRNLYKILMSNVRDAMNGHTVKASDITGDLQLDKKLTITKKSILGSQNTRIDKISQHLLRCRKHLTNSIKAAKTAEADFRNAKDIPGGSSPENAKHVVNQIIVPFFAAFTKYSNNVSTCVNDALEEFNNKIHQNAAEIAKKQSRNRWEEIKKIRADRKQKTKDGLATNPNQTASQNFENSLLKKTKRKYKNPTYKHTKESFYDDFDESVDNDPDDCYCEHSIFDDEDADTEYDWLASKLDNEVAFRLEKCHNLWTSVPDVVYSSDSFGVDIIDYLPDDWLFAITTPDIWKDLIDETIRCSDAILYIIDEFDKLDPEQKMKHEGVKFDHDELIENINQIIQLANNVKLLNIFDILDSQHVMSAEEKAQVNDVYEVGNLFKAIAKDWVSKYKPNRLRYFQEAYDAITEWMV